MTLQKGRQGNVVRGFQVVEDECIWSKTGMVQSRKCDNVFDCRTCPYDIAMKKTFNANHQKPRSGWANNVKGVYSNTNIPCRHALTGRVTAAKVCTNNYECNHCAYDQMLDEEDMDSQLKRPVCVKASGYDLAEDYYYHKNHTWARFEHGGRIKIGFDDFMTKLFGAISKITLPFLGTKLKKNKAGFGFSCNGEMAAALSPVNGTVLAINNKVQEHPEIIHEDPYNEGWMFIVESKMPKLNYRGLMYGKDSLEWTDKESMKLLGLMGPEYQSLAAAGGDPVDNIYTNFPDIGWDCLVNTFIGKQDKDIDTSNL